MVKSGKFGRSAQFEQWPCLFFILIIVIKNKLNQQTVKILMRRLIRSRLIRIFTVCKCLSEFTWCPKLPDFTLPWSPFMPGSPGNPTAPCGPSVPLSPGSPSFPGRPKIEFVNVVWVNIHLGREARKPVFGVSDKARHKPVPTATV